MKLYKSFFVIGAAASIMLIASQASSGPGGPDQPLPPPDFDAKSYRATGCQARPLDAVTYEFGGICNPSGSTTEVEVVCPIVRDNVEDVDGALITVDVGITSLPVECTAYSWRGPGGLVFQAIDEVTVSSSCCGFMSIFLQLEESVSGGSYSLSCKLPPDMSCILGYRVMEWEGSQDNMTDYNR